jgi:hypothetical protein
MRSKADIQAAVVQLVLFFLRASFRLFLNCEEFNFDLSSATEHTSGAAGVRSRVGITAWS